VTRAVFLDFYNTLARFDPPREQRQVQICGEFGLEPSITKLRRAYPAADDYFYQESVRDPVDGRSEVDRLKVFAEYERRILTGAGLDVSPEIAIQIWQKLRRLPSRFTLYEDALPSIQSLRKRVQVLGIISNITRNQTQVFKELGLDSQLDFIITSVDVPPGKPHPAIFLKALEEAHTTASEAIHVGDQYHIDVVGAKGVGIRPLLLDRDDFYTEITDCPRIKGLNEVEAYL